MDLWQLYNCLEDFWEGPETVPRQSAQGRQGTVLSFCMICFTYVQLTFYNFDIVYCGDPHPYSEGRSIYNIKKDNIIWGSDGYQFTKSEYYMMLNCIINDAHTP